MTRRALPLAILLLLVLAGSGLARADDLVAALARGEVVALIRHANAPGTGDPADMRIDDCATQRNLDAAGRDEARRLGARLRSAGLAQARLLSSRWCRCRDTAALLDLGPVEAVPALDSFFGAPQLAPARTAALREILAGAEARPLVLVTHQVNITALTGIVPAPAEIVFVDRSAPHAVRGRLR